jgi:hypothetical protein
MLHLGFSMAASGIGRDISTVHSMLLRAVNAAADNASICNHRYRRTTVHLVCSHRFTYRKTLGIGIDMMIVASAWRL